MVNIPTPPVEMVGFAVLLLVAGMTVPTRYGIERLNGFGRAIMSRLPYEPPPGQDAQEAMQAAVSEKDGLSDVLHMNEHYTRPTPGNVESGQQAAEDGEG